MRTITLTMEQVVTSAARIVTEMGPGGRVWGVPRGGVPVAMAIAALPGWEAAPCVEAATLIVDDIVATGRTREAHAKYAVPFRAVVEQPEPGAWYVFPWEGTLDGSAEDIPVRLLQLIGEDPTRDGLRDTPRRFVKAWQELTAGYAQDPHALVRTFENDEHYDQMVICRGISFFSVCEHHLLPFFGHAHVGYIPSAAGRVIGLSKMARVVECFARRLQVQERLTQQIADVVEKELAPRGVAVYVEAQHLCMMARGVRQADAVMLTSALRGAMLEQESSRLEFLLMRAGV